MSISHLGQPVGNHVTLRGAFGGALTEDIDFIRVNPDGLLSSFPPYFRVPKGKFLIITDVDWDCTEGNPRTRQTLTISIQNLNNLLCKH